MDLVAISMDVRSFDQITRHIVRGQLTHLVGNVVGQPVKPLVQPLSRGSTCALDVPENIRSKHI
jgi:hypothetical protein